MTRLFLIAALAAASFGLAACEVDSGTTTDEDGSTDRTVQFSVDEEVIDNAEDNLEAAGNAIQEGAAEAGEAIRDGAERVDDNVDIELGEEARDGDG